MVSFRANFLFLFINLIILFLMAGYAWAESSSDKEVTIYYTGNTYGYLKACPT